PQWTVGAMIAMADERMEHPVFLSTHPAGRRERRVALAAVLISAAIFISAAPFAAVPLAPMPAFIPIYESTMVINDLITAAFLFGQFYISRSRAPLLLAWGSLFPAAMAVPHALTFPGLFTPTGLLGAGPQSTAWLYMFWHAGFPLCVIGYSLLKGEFKGKAAVLASAAAVVAAAV